MIFQGNSEADQSVSSSLALLALFKDRCEACLSMVTAEVPQILQPF